MNDIKPIWQRPSKEVEEDEYKAFYKTFSKVSSGPQDNSKARGLLWYLLLCKRYHRDAYRMGCFRRIN